jgi:hypothetical protein
VAFVTNKKWAKGERLQSAVGLLFKLVTEEASFEHWRQLRVLQVAAPQQKFRSSPLGQRYVRFIQQLMASTDPKVTPKRKKIPISKSKPMGPQYGLDPPSPKPKAPTTPAADPGVEQPVDDRAGKGRAPDPHVASTRKRKEKDTVALNQEGGIGLHSIEKRRQEETLASGSKQGGFSGRR